MGLVINGQAQSGGGGGGGGVTQGTYTAMTAATPAVGDRWLVTSGSRRGSYYQCLYAGTWQRAALDLGLGDTPVSVFDAEDVQPQNGGLLREWRSVGSGSSLVMVTGVTPPTIVGASLGGMPAVSFTGTQVLRLFEPLAKKGLDHTVIATISSLAQTGNNGVLSVGDPTNTSGSFGLFGNFQASLSTRIYGEYNATGANIFDSGTTLSNAAGAHTLAWSWESSAGKSRLYADGAPTATASQVPGSTLGVLADASQLTLGAGRCNGTAIGTFYAHNVIIAPRRLSDAEVAAVHAILAGRFS